jgi:hypothetical protein
MKFLLLSIPILTFVACSGPESKTSTPQIAITEETIVKDTTEVQKEVSLDSLWQELVYEKGGCLIGGQRVVDGKFGHEMCVLTSTRNATRADWTPFFEHSDEELTDFLIQQLSDTSKTRIHTCPFFVATSGEVAVYCLSKIHLKNWYDLTPFTSYRDRKPTHSIDSEQAWLQEILEDSVERKVMIQEWRLL